MWMEGIHSAQPCSKRTIDFVYGISRLLYHRPWGFRELRAHYNGVGEETTTGIHFYLSVPLNSLTPPWEESQERMWGALPPASCSPRSSPAWLGLDSDRGMGGVPFLAQSPSRGSPRAGCVCRGPLSPLT